MIRSLHRPSYQRNWTDTPWPKLLPISFFGAQFVLRRIYAACVIACPLLFHVAAAGLFVAPFALVSPVLAQDDENGGAENQNGAGDDESQPAAGQPTRSEQSYLEYFFEALGIRYTVVFLFLSITLVALIIMNIVYARRENVVPLTLVESFEEHLNEKRYQDAYELAKADDSFLGRVLSAGLERLKSGYTQAVEAMQEVGEEENMRLEHRLSYISLIGSISPMVGLLGTVDGMVGAFSQIAQKTQAPSPPELAGDISTALITTLVGLWLAIPAIAVYSILRNRMARLVLEVGVVSEQLMSRFERLPATTESV